MNKASVARALEFKPLAARDWEALQRLYRQLQPNDPVVKDHTDYHVFLEILDSDHFFLLGAFEDTELIASLYINIVPNITRSASPYAVIENVITDTDRQNQGVGKVLMTAALKFIWGKGCYKAMLMTGSKQASTHAFYRSCGFDGEAKSGYVVYPD